MSVLKIAASYILDQRLFSCRHSGIGDWHDRGLVDKYL